MAFVIGASEEALVLPARQDVDVLGAFGIAAGHTVVQAQCSLVVEACGSPIVWRRNLSFMSRFSV